MQTEVDVIFGRILKAWRASTRQHDNLNLFFGFGKGDPPRPDVSCTIVLYNYPNYFHGTMTHLGRSLLKEPITDEWYVLRRGAVDAQDSEAPQYVTGWGNDIVQAMLDAEQKMRERFPAPQPKESP
jgi:hypothetical protein